jgi:hypothetical protein
MYRITGSIAAAPWPDEAHARVACGRRHRDPLLVDRLLLDGSRLRVLEDLPSCGRLDFVEERWLLERVGDLLRLRLQDRASLCLGSHEPSLESDLTIVPPSSTATSSARPGK